MLIDLSQIRVAPSLHWLQAFGLHLRNTPSSKNRMRDHLTMEAYLSDVRLFADDFSQVYSREFSPEYLNAANVQSYFERLSQECKPATYNRKLASMRMLISLGSATWA